MRKSRSCSQMRKYWKAGCLSEPGSRNVTRVSMSLTLKMCRHSISSRGLAWKAMFSVDTMRGDGMDRYRRVAFLLWRNEELAGNMMVGDLGLP